MKGKEIRKMASRVWENDFARHRYVPRANNPPDTSWDIWDQREGKWVTGAAVLDIDPDELLVRSVH